MSSVDVFTIYDLLFYISDFLDDKTSFRLFLVNKYIYSIIQNRPFRYSVKKYVSIETSVNFSLYKYKITKYIYTYKTFINSIVPKYLTHLKFVDKFNDHLDFIPDSVIRLTFGHKFNKYIDTFPPNLKYLYFGGNFNQRLNNLPDSLIQISFGWNFNQPIKSYPKSLESIVFGRGHFQSIKCIPKHITVYKM